MNKPVETALSVPLWIGGRPVASSSARSGEVTNPATGAIARRVPFCNASDIDAAVKAAQAAYPEWRDAPALRRARIMQRFLQLLQQERDVLARIVTEEHGKTLPDAVGSVQRGIEVVEFACGIPQPAEGRVLRERRAPASMPIPCASRSASASASRRSTSP